MEVGRKEERKGSGKIMEEEWMDGSITGFTELTASQHSTAPAILPAAAWTWVLALRWGAANRVYTGHVPIKPT